MKTTALESTPFFSIITVTRNAAEELRTTAYSVRNQTFTDYEWIVVDGASTDETIEIAKHALDPINDTLISEPDRGIYDAMNKGLRCAKGRYVNFLNAGDTYPDSNVLRAVHEGCNGADIVYGDAIMTLPNGLSRYRRAGPIEESIGRRIPFSHQSMFTERTRHQTHPFDTSYTLSADYAVIASLYVSGFAIRYLKRPLSVNSVTGASASVRGRRKLVREYSRIHAEILRLPRPLVQWRHLQMHMHLRAVKLLQTIPEPVARLAPESIRRRIY